MIKLLLVIPTLDRSGAEKQMTLLAEGLPRDRFDVRVIALVRGGPYADRLEAAGVPVEVLGKRWKFDPLVLWRLRSRIREWQPDIVNPWLFTANSYVRLVTGKRDRPRVVVSERCVDTWKSGWQRWLDRRQIGRTAHLVGNSGPVVDFYGGLGYPAERTSVIHNGIDVPDPVAVDREAVLRELGVPESSRIVTSIGRLAPQKRVRDLLWAMQLLRQITENVHLVVAGDGPERARLEQLAVRYECAPFVTFVGHHEDTARLLTVSDVFWLASDFEGLSNALMEAMAAGVPVVASDIPPNRELVNHECGDLVPVGDSPAFAKATARLLDEPEAARRAGEAGIARMRNEFSVAKMVASYSELFERVAL